MGKSITWEEMKKSLKSITPYEQRIMDLKSELIYTILKKRKLQKITLMKLSKKTGISWSHICKIERMEVEPRIGTLIKLYDALGLKLTVKGDI